MFARLYQFSVNPTRINELEKLADAANETLKEQKGFRSVSFYVDRATGECGSFSLWDAREDVDAYMSADFPQLKEVATDLFAGPSKSTVFEIYEPSGS